MKQLENTYLSQYYYKKYKFLKKKYIIIEKIVYNERYVFGVILCQFGVYGISFSTQ